MGYGAAAAARPYPVFKNFYGGGWARCAVRPGSLGRTTPPALIGAATAGSTSTAELYVPVPGAGNDRTLRMFGFLDMGNVWARTEKMTATACAPRPAWA